MVILDTDIVIDHLRAIDDRVSQLIKIARRVSRTNLAVSVITIQELYEGQSSRDKTKEEYLLATIAPLKIIPYTFEVAKRAGMIARDLDRSIEFADAAIAATAVVHRASLYTLNQRDFRTIKGLELVQ